MTKKPAMEMFRCNLLCLKLDRLPNRNPNKIDRLPTYMVAVLEIFLSVVVTYSNRNPNKIDQLP